MKPSRVIFIVVLSFFFSAVLNQAAAQPKVSVNINLQPAWGPVGYDYVEYYYLPQYEVYYYVPRHQFVYLDGGQWRFAAALPPRFGPVDYYSTYKVVINEPKAYLNYKAHKVKYVGGGPKQVVIRDSKEAKYTVVKEHPSNGGAKKMAAPAHGFESHGNNGKGGGAHGGGHGKGGKH